MKQARRNLIALMALAALTACGGGTTRKVLTYDGPQVTQIVVNKEARRMYLLNGSDVLKSYDVALGNNPVGAKRFEGDGKTPEGIYFIDRVNPRSRYHLSLGVSYPTPSQRIDAELGGQSPGGDIFIHGQGPEGQVLSQKRKDWTAGCIAVTDEEIREIWTMVGQTGVPVVINP